VGKATKERSALRCGRAGRAEFKPLNPLCQLARAVNGWGLFPSMAATNKSLALTDKS